MSGLASGTNLHRGTRRCWRPPSLAPPCPARSSRRPSASGDASLQTSTASICVTRSVLAPVLCGEV
ncbi:hypothetical protein EYF80_062515 [Liparis tanakae]|uniref:Uncharacterized protein n=1 Tax=Liparis tanakae TaxID=230148 RepID=A0A4Z2EF62_9TELE|nr:hypothetical protein EYF80_062515 [Liparis tanakae]